MRMLDLSEQVPCRGCAARWSWCASAVCRKEGRRLEGQSIRCSFDLPQITATSQPQCISNGSWLGQSSNSGARLLTMSSTAPTRMPLQPWFADWEASFFFKNDLYKYIYHFSFLVLICEVIEFVRIGWYCNRDLVGKPSTKCFSLLVVLSFIAVNGLCLAESQLTVEVMFCSAFCPWCKNYLNASWQTRNKHLNISTFEHNDKHLSSGPGQCG